MSNDRTLSAEEEATWRILVSTSRWYKDRISGDLLLNLHDWCAKGPDRDLWPDQDVRMKVIENGMLLEIQPNDFCLGWESVKGTPGEDGLRLEGSKIDRFREFFRATGLRRLHDFGEEQFRKFMSKYQDWLLPLLDEDEKGDFTSKIDGVIEFLSDKMKMKDTFVYMGWTACDHGFKGSLVFAYTKDDGSPALLVLAHGVVSVDKHHYMYIGNYPHADGIDTDVADSDTDADEEDARSDSVSGDDHAAEIADAAGAEKSEDMYTGSPATDHAAEIADAADAEKSEGMYTGSPATDSDYNTHKDARADNMVADADGDDDTIPYDPRWGPPMPPEKMDPYVGSLVRTYIDTDV